MNEININGEIYVKKSKIKETKMVVTGGDKSNPFMQVGKIYFIRTVTHYFVGELVWVGEKEFVLKDVSWIADTGRFSEFVAEKTVNEVEPFPIGVPVIIGRGSLCDMVERKTKLTELK